MLRIRCPFCGERDESEFRYKGDASTPRPPVNAGRDAFVAHVHDRANPQGLHLEWWLHVGGCRQVLKVRRHTLTHAIDWVGLPQQDPAPPGPLASP